jgi:hypothetical protein
MWSRGHLSQFLGACLLVAAVGACGGTGGSDQASPTETPIPQSATVSPSPGSAPSVTPPTVDALEEHLGGLIASTTDMGDWSAASRSPGVLSCDGSGPLTEGMAVRCDWRSEDPGASSGPVFVAVLDDTGRYTFSGRLGGFMSSMVVPSDFPAGTISCGMLKQGGDAVERGDASYGMDYPTVLHYWMSQGSPESMDDDRNGLPCETAYPADVVARVAGSPLVAGGSVAGGPVTREQVRAHAEAVVSGLHSPGPLFEDGTPESWGAWTTQTTRCGGGAAATAGSTLYCAAWKFDYGPGRQHGGYLISVLDDTGRYSVAEGPCCGAGPSLGEYPPGSTCRQLARPPTASTWTQGLDYRTVVFAWMLQGRPTGWDADGDGRPCEQAYPAEDVDAVFTSALRP